MNRKGAIVIVVIVCMETFKLPISSEGIHVDNNLQGLLKDGVMCFAALRKKITG
jgi:hypothetical protein